MAAQDQSNPVQGGKRGQPEAGAAVNSPSVKGSEPSEWAFSQPQQEQQQQEEDNLRRSETPLLVMQQQAVPRASMHTSCSPSPKVGGHISTAQGSGPESQGRSPALRSGEPPLQGSGSLHEGSPGAQFKASPPPQQSTGLQRASPSPQPCPVVAGSRTSPGPAPRAAAGSGIGPPADAFRASPFKTSSPSQSGTVPSSGIGLPLSHSRASPAVQHRMSPAALMPYVDSGASPTPHAQQPQPQPAFKLRASPSSRADVRASPSPCAQPPPPQPAIHYRASPKRPRALPYAQNNLPSPVAQMMVVPSQLKPPPQMAALVAGQVSHIFRPLHLLYTCLSM